MVGAKAVVVGVGRLAALWEAAVKVAEAVEAAEG